jgi:hypothetical protein
MRSEARFEITGWLSGEPRFSERQGNGGNFLTGSMTLSVSRRTKEGQKTEYRKYFVEVSGKSAERLQSDVAAGRWEPGDLISVKGEIVPPTATPDPETGKNKYGRTFLRCYEYTNWDDYSRGHAERRKNRVPKDDFKDFKFGEKKEKEEDITL